MAYKWFWWPQIFCIWERSEPEVLVVVPGMAHLVTLFFWGVSWHAPDPPWHFSEKHPVLPWAALFIMVVELLQGHTHTYTLFLYPRVMCHCSQHCTSWPGSLGALFMPLEQYSLCQYTAAFLSPKGGTWRLCSILWSFVGARKGNPLLLSTSEHTLHPVVGWVLGKLWFWFFQVLIQGKGWRI